MRKTVALLLGILATAGFFSCGENRDRCREAVKGYFTDVIYSERLRKLIDQSFKSFLQKDAEELAFKCVLYLKERGYNTERANKTLLNACVNGNPVCREIYLSAVGEEGVAGKIAERIKKDCMQKVRFIFPYECRGIPDRVVNKMFFQEKEEFCNRIFLQAQKELKDMFEGETVWKIRFFSRIKEMGKEKE